MNKQLSFFDLFSGIGGFKIGLERAGFKSIGFCDNDKYANMLYKAYFKNDKELFFEDVQSINTQELPDFDILCAGFPCQSFSIAGKRRGFEDTRGTMFFEVARILKDKRPRYFILENVKGLLNHESGKTLQTILKILSDIGYKTQWQLLNSKFFSVPQNRERIYIVGCLGNECTGKIFPITDPSSTNTRTCEKQNIVYWKNSTAKWVDEEKSEVGTIRTQSDLCRQPLLKQLPETKGYSQGNRIYDSTGIGSCLTANGGGQGGKAGLYYVKNGTKKGYDEANIGDGISLAYPLSKKRRGRVGHGCSQTLDTSCSMGTIDNSRIRRLTPLECFRLQGFPDDMYYTARKLGLADTHLYKMAGNAVTVNVVEAVAKRLAEAIKDLK